MTLLWLDDYRDPMKDNWLKFSPIPKKDITQVVWVKTYKEFKDWIMENGLPDAVCFDHDLCEEHMNDYFKYQSIGIQKIDYKSFREKTGLDCAKLLVEICKYSNKPLPAFRSQSANPIGRINILKVLEDFNNETDSNYSTRT
jgi:hypothetical protein